MPGDAAHARGGSQLMHGVTRLFPSQRANLYGLLRLGLARADSDVRLQVIDAGSQLGWIAAMVWPFKGGNGKIRSALKTLRQASETLIFAFAVANTLDGRSPGLNLTGNFA